jgi:Coiled stalk of trimeric autotransporter adhesin
MAIYKNIYQVSNGSFVKIDLATSGFQFQSDSFLVGAASPAELTKAILLNLISLQNGSEVGGSLHTHNNIYYTESELSSASGTTGSDLIGDDDTYTNFSPGAATVKAALSAIDTALSGVGSTSFDDSVFSIYDNGDATKIIRFQASGIATSTIRTITMPDSNVDLGNLANQNISASAMISLSKLAALTANRAVVSDGSGYLSVSAATATEIGYVSGVTSAIQDQIDGKVAKAGDTMSGVLNMGNNKISGLAAGTSPTDAINLSQLQNAIAGLDFQKDVDALVADASTTAPGSGLPAAALEQRYILASGTGSLAGGWGSISGVGNNDIVEYNGANWVVVYDVSVSGEGAIAWDKSADYFQKWDGSSWSEFGGLSGVTAGIGLSKSGNTLNVNLGAGIVELPSDEVGLDLYTASGLILTVDGTTPSSANGAQLAVRLDGATISRSASGIKITAAGVTATELANDAVTTSAILNANVTLAKLASQSVDDSKLVNTSNVYKSSTKTMLVAEDTNHYHNALQHDSVTAGESFASGAVYFCYMADAAGSARVFKATNDRSGGDKYECFVALKMATSVSAADPIAESNGDHIYVGGVITFPSAVFAAADVGKPVYLGTSGSYTLTAPDVEGSSNLALVKLGRVLSTTKMVFNPAPVVAVS